jgi:hypothetical protein
MAMYIGLGIVLGMVLMYVLMKIFGKRDKSRLIRPAENFSPKEDKKVKFKDEAIVDALNAKGCKFYGRDGCSWCSKQKAEFGELIDKINYVDCSQHPDQCASLQGVPHWTCADGSEHSGYVPLESLGAALKL